MPVNDTDRLVDLTFNVARLLRRRMVEASRSEDQVKNWLQVHALFVIAEREGITMKQLADVLMITAPTATTFIGRLVRMRCVVRVADPNNRKLVRLKITVMGKRLLKQHKARRMAVLRSILSHVPAKDQRELARIFSQLLHHFPSSPSLC